MKRITLFTIAILACFAVFGQDSTAVASSTDSSILDAIYNYLAGHLDAKVIAIVTTVAFILSEILPIIKWTPKNGVLATIWYYSKVAIYFLAGKKK